MAQSISDFKANFKGGARPNLYKCVVTFPDNNRNTTELATFMIKAASLPGSTIAPIPVPYRGRQFQVAGDRVFEPWTITVINDVDMVVRNAFESWMNLVNAHEDNTSAYSTIGDPLGYMSTMSVTQLDRDGDEQGTKTYDFIDAYPTTLSPIELGYETNDAVEEFTVDITYQYWTSNTTT